MLAGILAFFYALDSITDLNPINPTQTKTDKRFKYLLYHYRVLASFNVTVKYVTYDKGKQSERPRPCALRTARCVSSLNMIKNYT